MNTSQNKAALLAAGDVHGLLELNRRTFGSAVMARGYNSFADVMGQTADGRDLNALFQEFQAAADLANASQQRFIDLLTYPTSSPVVSVLQSLGTGDTGFEEASEYGVPTSKRPSASVLDMGATFKWYDNRWGASWQFLADATAAELQAATNAIIAADADLVFNNVMGTVFRKDNRTAVGSKGAQYTVYAFANGDGWTPPDYAGNTFSDTHTHYRTSGAATIVSGDLDELIADFKSHGYSEENGSQIVFFVNSVEGDVVSTFRVSSGDKADFVPAAGARFFSPDQLVGSQPSATFAGFPVKGAYDEALVIESSRIPAGYVVALASGGSLAPSNPIMLREHKRMKGLLLVPGRNSDYPLQDSYWVRGFGTGVRHRLAGHVMQITASATYTAPTLYAA